MGKHFVRTYSRDKNEKAIVEAIGVLGLRVYRIEVMTPGVPDLQVIYEGKIFPVEVKRPGKKLRTSQLNYAMNVYFAVIREVEHVPFLVEHIKGGHWFNKPGYYGEMQLDEEELFMVNHKVDPLDVL